MLDFLDLPPLGPNELRVTIHLSNGEVFVQELDDYDQAQEFMNWFRNPGKYKVWSWHCPLERTIHLFRHDQIVAVDIEGYIEPLGRTSRWYEKIFDKILLKRVLTTQ